MDHEKVSEGEIEQIHLYGQTYDGHCPQQVSKPARQKRQNFNPLQRKRLIPVQNIIDNEVAPYDSAPSEENNLTPDTQTLETDSEETTLTLDNSQAIDNRHTGP